MFDFSHMPQLETDRLILREITLLDKEAIFTLFGDPEVTRYNDVETLESSVEARMIIEFIADRFRKMTGMRWGIALRDDRNQLIGTCGYNVWTRHNNCAEIGYDLLPAYWGKGIMPEALQVMIRFGFRQLLLNRIEADVVVGNAASVRVLNKLGFAEEGILRQRGYWKGMYHDLHFFSLLRKEYERVGRHGDMGSKNSGTNTDITG